MTDSDRGARQMEIAPCYAFYVFLGSKARKDVLSLFCRLRLLCISPHHHPRYFSFRVKLKILVG